MNILANPISTYPVEAAFPSPPHFPALLRAPWDHPPAKLPALTPSWARALIPGET